ncbi:MAG: GNAT family N-acetyltransferase [Solirubrobacteraceae bacterium]
MTVRAARAEDESAIHGLHVRCVPDAFAGLAGDYVPPREQRVERERSWTGPIGAPHPRHALLVAERGDRVVGFTAVGPTRDLDDDRQSTGELRVLMVDADERGAGIGSALLAAAAGAMRQGAFAVATLWVVPENARAIGLYRRAGWSADGADRFGDFGGCEIRCVRYRKPLVP